MRKPEVKKQALNGFFQEKGSVETWFALVRGVDACSRLNFSEKAN